MIRAGHVAIVGRPNVGKSTLVNMLVGTQLAAVSPKPQTSRYRILAVLHGDGFQVGLLDTPGRPAEPRLDALSRRMLRETRQALEIADLAVLISAPREPGDVEETLLEEIRGQGLPTIVAVNKLDTVRKSVMLPVIEAYNELYSEFRDIVPISAQTGDGLELLLERIIANLPEQEPLFDPSTLTDRSEAFLISELIREGVFAVYGDEVPYATAVEVETHTPQDPEHGGQGLHRGERVRGTRLSEGHRRWQGRAVAQRGGCARAATHRGFTWQAGHVDAVGTDAAPLAQG